MAIYSSFEDSFLLDFYLPECPLIGAPAVTAYADANLDGLMTSDTPPQAVFMEVEADLSVAGIPLESAIRALRGRAYPILRFTTPEAGAAIAAFAHAHHLGDVTLCVPYACRAILPTVRAALPLSRGMLDMRGADWPLDPLDLVGDAQESDATMVLWNGRMERKQIQAYRKRFLQIWLEREETDALLSGVCGILTRDVAGLYARMAAFPLRSTTHPTLLFAHKGLHKNGVIPENSIQAAVAAGREGYDAAEVDAALSRDMVALLQHDGSTWKLFDRTCIVAETDWAELAALRRKDHPDVGLDRMDDLYTSMAAYPDTPILLEFKAPAETGGVEEITSQLQSLFARPDVQKHSIGLLGGTVYKLAHVHRNLPRFPMAHCTGQKEPVEMSVEEANRTLFQFAQATPGGNAAWNPSWQEVTPLFSRLAHLRGVTVFVWSWAFTPWEEEILPLSTAFAAGYDALTSDWVEPFAHVPVAVESVVVPDASGESAEILCCIQRRDGTKATVPAQILPLSGACIIQGARVTGRGSVRLCTGYSCMLPDGKSLCVLSEAVTVVFHA